MRAIGLVSVFVMVSLCEGTVLAVEQDVTPYGAPVALVTAPLGGGSRDIEVIRDGVTPAPVVGLGAGPSLQQYDTWDGANTSLEDWVGYEFAGELDFTRVVFQEGNHFGDGGYFDPPASLVVQVRDLAGTWTDAEGGWDPPYTGLLTAGQARGFETFTWTMPEPVQGTGIRIWGEPGGSADFISVGELRAFADLDGDLPKAAFAASPPAGPRPLAVAFDASGSTGSNLTFDWDFGDGGVGTGVSVSHTYTDLGVYTVTLTVTATLPGMAFGSTARGEVVVGFRLSDVGRPVARVAAPTGGGNHDIRVIHDGVKPPLAVGQNAGDSLQQYDTYDGENAAAEDWIGYELDCAFPLSLVVFQEGKHFGNGGYFDPPESLVVQYRDPGTGEWLPADGEWDPPYQGELTDFQIVDFETFAWQMPDPVAATGIRLWGEPGGSADFVSVAELEVFADIPYLVPKAAFSVTPTTGTAPLAVQFDAGASVGTDLTFAWDFGDGQTGSGVAPSHTYTEAGRFTATLTVSTTVGEGCVVTSTATATIQTAFNLAPLGVIVARVSNPQGGGSWDPEVIRDRIRPDVTVGENVGDSLLQYDTWDGNDVVGEDWIGYVYGCTYRFSQVVFQEGKHFFDGGYFDPPEALVVQVRDPATGAWNDAPGDWTPAYPGQLTDGEVRSFETFVWTISPTRVGDGIRIWGVPGGSAAFISVAELEVYASGISGSPPTAVVAADVVNGSAPLAVAFDSSGSTAPAGSTYRWAFGDGQSATGPTASHTYADPGTYMATLTVTAPGGLCAAASVAVTVHPSDFTTAGGFVRTWLLLGPYAQPNGPNPLPETMELDYLTDGADVLESDILPSEGLAVATAFGVAASTGLVPTGGRPDLNPGGVPTWFAWRDGDDTVDFLETLGTNPIESFMMYACVYVTNELAEPIQCDIGCASDDAVQIILGEDSVHTNSIGRGYGIAEEIQDVVSGVTLPPGEQVRLLVKVFQGAGGAGFRLRFQAADGTPIAEPDVTFSLEPGEGPGGGFRRGDANADGGLNITDGIFVLNYLFLGGDDPPCQEAANANDDEALNITDGIYILNYLFLGGGAPPAPGPDDCGPKPPGSPSDLGCASYPEC